MGEELIKFKNSKKNIALSLIIFLIMMSDIILIFGQNLINSGGDSSSYHYIVVSFLSGGSIGHIPQIILFWFLPIIVFLLIGDRSIDEINCGYQNMLITRKGKTKYVREKVVASFIITFVVIFVSIILNLFISSMLFKAPIDSEYVNLLKESGLNFTAWQYENYISTYLIYVLIVCWFSGLISVLVTLFGIIVPDKKIVLSASFFFWIFLVYKEKSIMNIFQPFTEYDLVLQSNIFLSSNIILLVMIIIFSIIIKVRRNYV
ncbi:MAG: hypothetical protein ACRDCB_09970 [Clostridium sp.]